MKKPNENAIKLMKLGWIQGIEVDYQQTGNDTADTYCVIKGSNGTVKGLWRNYKDYLNVRVGHNYVATVKSEYERQYRDWILFEEQNKKELEEYERLKAKFG